MIKLFFLNFWSNIKRSPIVSIILLIQIFLFSYGMFNALWEQSQSDINNDSFQGAYTKYSNYAISFTRLDPEINRASYGRKFESVDNTGFELFETLYEKIMEYGEFETAVLSRTQLNLSAPFDGIPANQETMSYYSFYQPIESVPPTYQPNTFSIDQNFIDIFNLTLDSGRFFTEEEYHELDPTCVPVLLGHDYKEYFSIGDTFEGTLFLKGEPMTFKVIGFISNGQLFMEPGSPSAYSFNNHIILPQISKTVPEWLDFYEKNQEYVGTDSLMWQMYTYGLGTDGFGSTRYLLVEIGKEKDFTIRMNEIFDEVEDTGYYELMGRPASSMQVADNVDEKNALLTVLVLIMSFFAIASIVFSAINNASNNMKAYAIHTLVGATRIQIVLFSVVETFIYCIIGLGIGFLLMYSSFYEYGYLNEPAALLAINKWRLFAIIFIVFSCILSLIFVYVKVKNYSIAELIRGRDVRKARVTPLYKGITFVMFLLTSICITFLTSYSWQVEHVDRYQNNFWGKKGYLVYITSEVEDVRIPVDFEFQVDEVEDYSIDIMVNLTYRPFEAPRVRGWYKKGDMAVPEVTWGRFFTEEELVNVSDYAVVGKNVFEEFGVEENGKKTITYEGRTYEVIGICGREGHDTTVDDWVFITVPTALKRHITNYNVLLLIDGKNEEDIFAVRDNIRAQVEEKYIYNEVINNLHIDLGVSHNTLQVFAALIFLTSIAFGIYYIDKIKHIISVKKFIGYSRKMIFVDTAGEFMFISLIAFTVGNAVMWILSKTLFKDIILFSSFKINLPVLTFSFGMILLVAFFFSVIAINKAFRGSARDLKRG